jgi:hypothetical protein
LLTDPLTEHSLTRGTSGLIAKKLFFLFHASQFTILYENTENSEGSLTICLQAFILLTSPAFSRTPFMTYMLSNDNIDTDVHRNLPLLTHINGQS